MQNVSVNQLAKPLVQELIDKHAALRVRLGEFTNGARYIDAGIDCRGGLEAGRLIGEICMGGLGRVTLYHAAAISDWPLSLHVHTSNPVLACLASQYAGWSLSHEKFHALGSGPGRAIALREVLFEELGYRDSCDHATFVLEVDQIPPVALIDRVAEVCNLPANALTFILTPTRSIAGMVQIVSRVLEVAMHKAHTLKFPLDNILDGSASAPLSPPSPSFVTAMERTNTAILFAGRVHLFVQGDDASAEKLSRDLPSSASSEYGKPFAQVLEDCGNDFFKIDPMLFSPASVVITAVESGKTFRGGSLAPELLAASFS
ncbi:MAG: methenyltetrahydromethanopterin cyclohydrolase [Gammaproteobacteria bacterium]|nr:methenyltetrahydromethanopterin cyclohydrolase [Gammaproteobacteria bacterium]